MSIKFKHILIAMCCIYPANFLHASCLPDIIARENLPYSKCDKADVSCIKSKVAPDLYSIPEGVPRPHIELSGTWECNEDAHFYAQVIQPFFTNRLDYDHGLNTTFFQGQQNWHGDNKVTNLGVVYRHMPGSCRYILGANMFIDKSHPHNHKRFSFGGDLETYTSRLYFNIYMPMNDWKPINDRIIERPLSGWEIAGSKRFEDLPALEVICKYFRFDRRCFPDIHGFEAKAEYTPYPIFTAKAGYANRTFCGETNDVYVGGQLNYHFGIPFKEQITRKTELRPIPKRIHDKVRRIDVVWTEKKDQVANPNKCNPANITIVQNLAGGANAAALDTGETIDFFVRFSEGTGIGFSGPNPELNFNFVIGSTTIAGVATYVGISGDVIQFRHTVATAIDGFGSIVVTGIDPKGTTFTTNTCKIDTPPITTSSNQSVCLNRDCRILH